MPKLFIAAGHSYTDPGATSQFGNERDIVIPTITQAINLCKTQSINAEIVRVPDELDLDGAIAYINARCNPATDLCLEVHLNSNAGAPGTGTETYPGFVQLAEEIHQEVVKVLGLRDRGIKPGDWLKFNNSTNCASSLLEMGFVNNWEDVSVIKDRGGLALAKAMVRACNSQWVDIKPPVTPPIVIPPVVVPEPPVIVPEPPVVIEPPIVVVPPVEPPKRNWLVLLLLWIISKIEASLNKKG